MKKAKLILDEQALSLLIFNMSECADSIDKLISAADNADSHLFDVFGASDEYFYSIDIEGENLSNKLYCPENAEFRDLVLRLQIMISRLESFPEMVCNSGSVSLGLYFLECEGMGALLSCNQPASISWWSDERMSLVSGEELLAGALRKHYMAAKVEEKYFSAFCEGMFPDIYFHESADKIKNLGVSYEDNINSLISYFSYLNDYASDHFDCEEDSVIIANAGSKGVMISPESPKTRRNSKAMEEREVVINGDVLCCEWHAKVTNTHGRIHFYARKHRSDKLKVVTGEKVVVGVMANHLTT